LRGRGRQRATTVTLLASQRASRPAARRTPGHRSPAARAVTKATPWATAVALLLAAAVRARTTGQWAAVHRAAINAPPCRAASTALVAAMALRRTTGQRSPVHRATTRAV